MHVVDFAPRVRPARRFLYLVFAVQLVELGVSVRLQHNDEPGQVRLRMDAFSVRRVRELHRRGHHRARVAVVAHVDPQATGFGFAVARQQNQYGGIIGMKLAVCQHVARERFIQRRQQLAARVNPARQQRAAERVRISPTAGSAACAPRTSTSAPRQQPRTGDAALDGPQRCGCLHDAVALITGVFSPNGVDTPERAAHQLQLLCRVLAQVRQRAATFSERLPKFIRRSLSSCACR